MKIKKMLMITLPLSILFARLGDYYFRGQIDELGTMYYYFGSHPKSLVSIYCDAICNLEKGWPLVTTKTQSEIYNYSNLIINILIYFVIISLILLITSFIIRKLKLKNIIFYAKLQFII